MTRRSLASVEAASLIVTGGKFYVDSSGRVGLPVQSPTATMLTVGGGSAGIHPGSEGALYGIVSNLIFPNTTNASAFDFYARLFTAAAAFTLPLGVGYYVDAPSLGAGSAVTTASGLHVVNQGASGITNAYGLYVAAQSAAATLNVGGRIDTGSTCALWLGGDAAGTAETGGILFGSGRDVNLYRGAADQLRTDDSLFVGASLQASAATLASLIVNSSGGFFVDASGRVGLGALYANDRMLNILPAVAHPGTAAALYGVVIQPIFPSTTTTSAMNFYSQIRTAAAAFTLATAYAYHAPAPSLGAGSAITTIAGLQVANQGVSGVTNAYGLLVAAQSGAATLNIGARVDRGTQAALWVGGSTAGTDEAGGVVFGSGRDVNLYRSAADTLKTDDALVVGGALDSGSHTLADAANVIVGTGTGTKIGTATSQKLGFFNATPVAQIAGTVDLLASLVTLGLRAASSNPPLDLGSGALGSGTHTLTDAANLVVGSTTGTKIGTATTQKLGFFNATPIVQPVSTSDLRALLVNLGLLASGGATPLDLNGGALTAASATVTGAVTSGSLDLAVLDLMQVAA